MTLTTGLRNRPAAPGCSAFTLLELILVMVIMCTVLAMAAPSLRGFFASRKTADEAARILSLIHLARSEAVTEGRVYRLNFDAEKGEYWLTVQEGGAFRNLKTEFGRVFTLADGATAQWETRRGGGSREYVEFHPNGRTDAAIIRLTGRQGEVYDVECLSPTDRFQITCPFQREER